MLSRVRTKVETLGVWNDPTKIVEHLALGISETASTARAMMSHGRVYVVNPKRFGNNAGVRSEARVNSQLHKFSFTTYKKVASTVDLSGLCLARETSHLSPQRRNNVGLAHFLWYTDPRLNGRHGVPVMIYLATANVSSWRIRFSCDCITPFHLADT